MLCEYFHSTDASHCLVHAIKTIEPLNVRKGKQGLCPQINADESVFSFKICVHLWMLFFAFTDLRSLALFADKYSLCGQGVITGLPTVFGEDPKNFCAFCVIRG